MRTDHPTQRPRGLSGLVSLAREAGAGSEKSGQERPHAQGGPWQPEAKRSGQTHEARAPWSKERASKAELKISATSSAHCLSHFMSSGGWPHESGQERPHAQEGRRDQSPSYRGSSRAAGTCSRNSHTLKKAAEAKAHHTGAAVEQQGHAPGKATHSRRPQRPKPIIQGQQ